MRLRTRTAIALFTVGTSAALLLPAHHTPPAARHDGMDMAAMHMVEPGPGAYRAYTVVLPRTGRKVSTTGPALTIALAAPTTVSGLTYTPPAGEQVGRFEVTVSADGVHFGPPVATGTWADDPTRKAAAFAAVTARAVRLTAVGSGAAIANAADVDLVRSVAAPNPVAPSATLPRDGWTATASDAETQGENTPPGNVLDGDPATFWHSQYNPAPPLPLPHWITIDMHQSVPIGGLTYLPRPGGGNGTIGQYEVAVSGDNTTWRTVASGTWIDGAAEKTVTFPRVVTRYVRLTARSEAGNRGPWSSAAEINLLGALDASVYGQWGPVINFPIVPVSTVLLPNNKLLTFSAYSPTAFGMNDGYTQTAILDLTTGVVSQREISNTGHEMFCSGIALLPDGRVLVNGGSDSGATSIYSPATDAWTAGPAMNIPRGYQADTTLSNGSVFTLGGSWSGGEGGKDAEVYTPDGTWRLVPNITAASILTNDPGGVYRADNHGWFFSVAGNRVFHAGPSSEMHWFNTAGNGTVTDAGARGTSADAMNGDAVMYDVNKILTLGGSTAYKEVPATTQAYTIDISGGPTRPVSVVRTGDMGYARSFANSVVLPNGQVFVVGGQSYPEPFSDDTAIMTPELWSPSTGTFAPMAPQAVPRTYHSVAVLLPDGRVFSGGGGLCGGCTTNHPDGQIFTPPYLLNPNGTAKARPAITSAPTSAVAGSTIAVQATSSVRSFVLVRTGATTHTVNTDQRRIPLTVAARSGTSFQLKIPASRGVTIPGYYLLFAINASGTPSVAATINIP